MSDIADKIYAATGLTLGAEEAAKIGQMIQVEAADRITELEAALQARVAELEEALGTLEKGASYTAKLGAVTGAHWLGLGSALIKARAALEGGKKDE